MIHDGTPHCIFEISELAREIASQLVLVSPWSTVNFGCACRRLEEPVLSTLWESQSSLCTLLEVLPSDIWRREKPAFIMTVLTIVEDPLPGAWNRVQRYASWMHRIEVDEWRVLGEDSVRKFRSNSPAGGWFPALQVLHWTIAESNLHYADLFLSRHLTDIFISPSSFWFKAGIPHDVLPAVASTIYTFPTSALRSLRIHSMKPQEGLHGPLSSVVLRCGPSLTKFDSMIPLSDAATTHLFRLPHLHTWHTKGPPPVFPPSSLPLVFPPLVELALCDRSACGWLSILERSEQTVPTTQGSSGVRESLRSLIIRIPPAGIDGSLLSKIRILRNLVYLSIQFCCSNGRCGFKLNNDDVAKLAMALPQIETLVLGYTCGENTCATTVACFLPISACCVKLQYLRIHFSTTNIIDDLKNVFEDPRFQELSSLPRCALTRLDADHVPLSFEEAGLETVARGLVDLFPSLERCLGYGSWGKISEIIGKLRDEPANCE